jgi:lysophospholipid acyltransferase (LPLAT)-like uncharacterized protein
VPQPSSDESRYSLFERVKFSVLSSIAAGVVWLIGCTLRPTMSHEDPTVQSLDEFQTGIFPFWHRCVLPAIWIFRRRRFTVITSQSRDGEYIARAIRHFGFLPVRGSSSRGGQRALLEAKQLLEAGHGAAFTVDGPRGPRYVAKKGPVVLARISGVPITVFYVAVKHAWVLPTWDAMIIPKPFSRLYVRAARKIFVPPDADDAALERYQAEMQAALERATAFAESQCAEKT